MTALVPLVSAGRVKLLLLSWDLSFPGQEPRCLPLSQADMPKAEPPAVRRVRVVSFPLEV